MIPTIKEYSKKKFNKWLASSLIFKIMMARTGKMQVNFAVCLKDHRTMDAGGYKKKTKIIFVRQDKGIFLLPIRFHTVILDPL